jgi:hypothetical protein
MDVWPDLFRCVQFWTVDCKEVIQRHLSKELVNHLLDATFDRAVKTFESNRPLHLAMMGFHPYTWRTHGDTYLLASLVDANIVRFQDGKVFIDMIYDNMKGCVLRYAPGTIEGCCWGMYARAHQPAQQDAAAAAPIVASEPLYKKAKSALNKLWSSDGALTPGTPDGGFSQNVHDEIKLFFRRLGELNHLPDLL